MSREKRTWAPLPTATAACLLALLAAAPAAPAELLDKRIDISVEKADAADLFRSFAEIANLKLDMDPAVQGTVSLRASSGCAWGPRSRRPARASTAASRSPTGGCASRRCPRPRR